MKVKIKRIDKRLPLPIYQTKGSVGCDLYARETTTIQPRTLRLIPTNVIIQTPPGYMFAVVLRGSTPFKKGLLSPHGFGVGDQDFSGPNDEYQIVVYNFTNQKVVVERGERIAQGIFIPIEKAQWKEIDVIEEPNRGGFGSTGER